MWYRCIKTSKMENGDYEGEVCFTSGKLYEMRGKQFVDDLGQHHYPNLSNFVSHSRKEKLERILNG